MSLRAAQDISSIASLRQGFNPCLSNVHYFLLSRSFILSLSFSMSFSLYPIHPILGMDLQWQMNMVGRVVGVCVCEGVCEQPVSLKTSSSQNLSPLHRRLATWFEPPVGDLDQAAVSGANTVCPQQYSLSPLPNPRCTIPVTIHLRSVAGLNCTKRS